MLDVPTPEVWARTVGGGGGRNGMDYGNSLLLERLHVWPCGDVVETLNTYGEMLWNLGCFWIRLLLEVFMAVLFLGRPSHSHGIIATTTHSRDKIRTAGRPPAV